MKILKYEMMQPGSRNPGRSQVPFKLMLLWDITFVPLLKRPTDDDCQMDLWVQSARRLDS